MAKQSPAASTESLTALIKETVGDSSLRVEESLGSGYVRLLVAEAERRQAKHDIRHVEDAVVEMLRNARDAGASHVLVAMAREQDVRTLVLLDDGEGIPEDLHERIFDARVTSKLESMSQDRWGVHGRGMALYSIRQNALESRVVASGMGRGSALLVRFDVSTLPERADQSSWPSPESGEGQLRLRGPHNVIRTCCEVSIESKGKLSVYVGSPSEVVATACELASRGDVAEDTLIAELGESWDAASLAERAAALGLDMSERTAHRILASQIAPLPETGHSIRKMLKGSGSHERRDIDLLDDRRSLRIAAPDMKRFSRALERDFKSIGDAYYVRLIKEPDIRVSRGKMTVSFEFEHED